MAVATNNLRQRHVPDPLLGAHLRQPHGGIGLAAGRSYLAGAALLELIDATTWRWWWPAAPDSPRRSSTALRLPRVEPRATADRPT